MNSRLTWADCLAPPCPTPFSRIVTVYGPEFMPSALVGPDIGFHAENGLICIVNSVNKSDPLFPALSAGFIINIVTPDVLEKCCGEEPLHTGLSFTAVQSANAPRIDEALVSLECETLWNKDYFNNSTHCLLCARVVGVSANESWFDTDGTVKPEKQGWIERLSAHLNPETGQPLPTFTSCIESK